MSSHGRGISTNFHRSFRQIKNPYKKGFLVNKLSVARGGIEPPTQGFSGLCILLENSIFSTTFRLEECGNNSFYRLFQKRVSVS